MIHPDPRGIIFDMDGTLTVPVISFVDMRRDIAKTQLIEPLL